MPDRNSDIYATFTAAMIDPLPKKQGEFLAVMGLADAAPFGFVMPFVENYDYLQPILAREIKSALIVKIIELGEAAKARKATNTRPIAFNALTQRESEIVNLMAQRLSNREIAERLFLSEGSVKQYMNQMPWLMHLEFLHILFDREDKCYKF